MTGVGSYEFTDLCAKFLDHSPVQWLIPEELEFLFRKGLRTGTCESNRC